MTQTLLAVLALGMAAVFALQQSQTEALADRGVIENEVARQATDVALAQLAFYETLAYDEATATGERQPRGRLIAAIRSHGNQPGDTFGNDVDDYHLHTETVRRPVAADTLDFSVLTRVAYVSETDGETPSALPTHFKKVTVTVTPDPSAETAPVSVSELYMCGSNCSF